jgi:hypothetical protein
MDKLGVFTLGFFVGALFASISIAWNMSMNGTITIEPVKDDYKNEIIYYVDIHTKKTYKMENDILYYYEED